MLTEVHPVLPMRNKQETKSFYVEVLGFNAFDEENKWEQYLMVRKDNVELHFSLNEDLNVEKNICSCYIRTDDIEEWFNLLKDAKLNLETGLQEYPWKQKEFVLRDPNYNQLIFASNL